MLDGLLEGATDDTSPNVQDGPGVVLPKGVPHWIEHKVSPKRRAVLHRRTLPVQSAMKFICPGVITLHEQLPRSWVRVAGCGRRQLALEASEGGQRRCEGCIERCRSKISQYASRRPLQDVGICNLPAPLHCMVYACGRQSFHPLVG